MTFQIYLLLLSFIFCVAIPVNIKLLRNNGSASLVFDLNVEDDDIIGSVEHFCIVHEIGSMDCDKVFDYVVRLRYLSMQRDLDMRNSLVTEGVISPNLIPNPHLQRNIEAVNAELSSHIDQKRLVDDEMRKIDAAFDIIIRILEMIDSGEKISIIHSCNFNTAGTVILNEIIEQIIESKLMAASFSVIVLNYGVPVDVELTRYEAYENLLFLQVSNLTTFFEIPSLMLLRRISQYLEFERKKRGVQLLYTHTKGVSYSAAYPQIEDWRNFMLYFLVQRHRACGHLLASGVFDVLGVNYGSPQPQLRDLRGNFWWTTSTHVKRLPQLTLVNGKYDAERWVMNASHVRIYNMYESAVDHHFTRFPADKYDHVPIASRRNIDGSMIANENDFCLSVEF